MNKTTGYASIDFPWELSHSHINYQNYNSNFAKKTALEMIYPKLMSKPNIVAYDYYNKILKNSTLLENIAITASAYKNLGITKDDTVFILGINTLEIYYTLWALNNIGAISEWFNPLAISPGLLKKYILEDNIKYIFAVDVMYDVIKEAIKDTNVCCVIINSVRDSFPLKMNVLYDSQVFGISHILNNNYIRKNLIEIKEKLANAKEISEYQKTNIIENTLLKIDEYAIKNKIKLKASYYLDKNRDSRFLSWNDFISNYSRNEAFSLRKYEEGKPTFAVHTGGTTGPVKRIYHTDYQINSGVYQASLAPLGLREEMKSIHVIPPIVALGLENAQLERYYNMYTQLISTYDKNEFVPLIKKYKPNLLVCVPSFTSEITDNNKKLKPNDDLSYIEVILQGGESFPEKIDRLVDKTLKKHNSKATSRLGFGQNEEFGGFTFCSHIDEFDKKYDVCGIPLPGNKITIYDTNLEKEVRYGKNKDNSYNINDLYVSGPTVMLGYFGSDKKENENSFRKINGEYYFNTGDQAYIDDNGILHWVTRNRRIIRTQDGKIFTNVLEEIINKMDEILECCVVAAPDEKIVKVASCHIVLKPEYQKLPLEEYNKIIRKIVRSIELATSEMYSYYTPRTYEFRSERLPYTTYGKVAFTELEKLNTQEYEGNHQRLQKIRIR